MYSFANGMFLSLPMLRLLISCVRSNPSIKVTRARHDESTSNLVCHANSCDPAQSSASRAITAFAQGSTYTAPKLRMKLALWVVRHHRSFAIVADADFIDILHDLDSRVIVPSPQTVSRDVQDIFKITRTHIIKMLQVSLYHRLFFHSHLMSVQSNPGRFHICIDRWTSPNIISFLGLTLHWVVDGKMQSIILDFIQ
jgi:hypothetical protein